MAEKGSILAIFSIAARFIKRPILATVHTLVILLLGAICAPLSALSLFLLATDRDRFSQEESTES
jgi:hypothetical protein